MKFFFHLKITILMISSMIQWPEPGNPSACSREFSLIVRNFVSKKWYPIFNKFKAEIPLNCPLNPERDMFQSFHQSKVQVDPAKWSCSLCGKAFYTELYLELHMLKKHKDKLLLVEDSVCPADFCDLIRCEVLQFGELSKNRNQSSDFQSSKERHQTTTALVKATPPTSPLKFHKHQADNCLTNDEQCKKKGWLVLPSELHQDKHCCPPASQETVLKKEANVNDSVPQCHLNSSNSQFSETTSSSREEELSARIKEKQSQCRDENFIRLRSECALLIDMCTSGLILSMTNQQFIHLKDELNRSVCWHLQCDRYWLDVLNPDDDSYTLLLLATAFAVIGLASSYVIVCVLCQEPSISSTKISSPCVNESSSINPIKEREMEKSTRYNGVQILDSEWNVSSKKQSSSSHSKRTSSSFDRYSKRFDSSFIVHADVEENSLI